MDQNKLSYLLGSILGDGCLYVGKGCYQLSITAEDYDFCEICSDIIEEFFNKKRKIKTIKRKDGSI